MSSRWVVRLGIGFSILILGAGLAPLFFFGSDPNTLLQNLGNLGQFVAGIFAPLAFVWVVVAVLLQGRELELQRDELANSRRALELQATELHKSVEQLTAQSRILEGQFDIQRRQKALRDIQEGIHGVCSIIIEKFAGNGMLSVTGGKLTCGCWLTEGGLHELLENENYTFLIEEISRRMNQRANMIKGRIGSVKEIAFTKSPHISEMESIIGHAQRILIIPENEACLDLQAKFDFEYPIPVLVKRLTEVRDLCVTHNLAKA